MRMEWTATRALVQQVRVDATVKQVSKAKMCPYLNTQSFFFLSGKKLFRQKYGYLGKIGIL